MNMNEPETQILDEGDLALLRTYGRGPYTVSHPPRNLSKDFIKQGFHEEVQYPSLTLKKISFAGSAFTKPSSARRFNKLFKVSR